MSGRNQHHFWQVLQRGFGYERKQGYTTVFAYLKDRPPFPTTTRNIGAERDFFDLAPGSGADDQITKTEDKLQSLVKYLQNGGALTADHTISLSLLIAHLETRTKFLRQHFGETVSDLLGALNHRFKNPKQFQKLMKSYAAKNPDEIDAFLAQHVQDSVARAALTEFIIDNFDKLGADIVQSASNDAAVLMQIVAENTPEFAKQSHIKALLNTDEDGTRQNRYANLTYRIKSGFDGNLICPDTMVAFLTGATSKPFLDMGDKLEAVWVPLTSNLMLIGEPRTSSDRSPKSVLRLLAGTSHTTFIANADTPELRRLASRIGKNAEILSRADIKAIKRDTFKI